VTLMWEVRVADGRVDDLIAYVSAHADPSAQIFRSRGADPRVVVIDPTDRGLPDVPSDLLARAPHEWRFDEVLRHD
jgi:hypothetical protein